ncbi:hypothetical protein HK405_011888, partial [Cladochytrium tenue]
MTSINYATYLGWTSLALPLAWAAATYLPLGGVAVAKLLGTPKPAPTPLPPRGDKRRTCWGYGNALKGAPPVPALVVRQTLFALIEWSVVR